MKYNIIDCTTIKYLSLNSATIILLYRFDVYLRPVHPNLKLPKIHINGI